jgi:hypothetical protein
MSGPVIVDTAGTYTGSGLTRMGVPNVGINTVDNAFPALQQGPFTNSQNRYLVLANEGTFGVWDGTMAGGPATPCVLRVWKSSDKGSTWAEQDSANAKGLPTYNNTNATIALTTAGFASYACAQQGSVILIARLVWDGVTHDSYTVVISRFSMASDTWLADLTATGDANAPVVANPDTGLDNAQSYNPLGIFLTVRPSDQHLFLTYGTNVIIAGSFRQTHGNHSYVHTRMSQWAAGWSAPVLLFADDTIAQDFQPQGTTADRNNLLTFFAINVAGNAGTDNSPFTTNILCQTLTSLGVLSGNQPVTPVNAADPSENELTAGVPILRPVGVADEIILPYLGVFAAGHQSLVVAPPTSGATPTWTQQTISTDNSKYSDEFSGRGALAVGYTNDGKLYVWSPGSNVTAVWQFTNPGAGWDGGTVVFTSAVVNGLSSISAYHDPNLDLQGVVFGNGPLASSPYSDDWYFELGGMGVRRCLL